MKTLLILMISAWLLLGWQAPVQNPDEGEDQPVIVLLKFKAQQGKGELAVSELASLLEQVKEEPHFVSIKLHVDPDDNTNILLYEAWEDADYYNSDHMNTAHLKAFMENSKNFLAGPPDITFWQVDRVFE